MNTSRYNDGCSSAVRAEGSHARGDEIRGRIVGAGHRVDGVAQHVEQARCEGFEQARLRSEDAVDGARRRADLLRDGTHGRRVGAVHVDQPFGRVEERDPGAGVVLLGAAHG